MLVLRWVVEVPPIGRRGENLTLYWVVGAIKEVHKVCLWTEEGKLVIRHRNRIDHMLILEV
jgi:hypothetical protein